MDDYKIIDVDVHNEQDDRARHICRSLALRWPPLVSAACRLYYSPIGVMKDSIPPRQSRLRSRLYDQRLIEGYNLDYAVLTGSSTTFHQRMIRITRRPYARPITIT